jgi:hypothetical protein
MKLKTTIILLCLLAALSGLAGQTIALATEVFKWTDEDGIVHFSDMPRENGASEQINVQGVYKPGTLEPAKPASEEQAEPGETPQSAAQQRRERMAQEREERREAREETEQMCARHRSRLEQMEPARRVFVTNEDGESERLDDDQRMALINESKEFIAKNCE